MSDVWPGTQETSQLQSAAAEQWPGTPEAASQSSTAAVTANDNPDQTAKILQWSKKSTVPPAVIEADPAGFEKDFKVKTATDAVEQSPAIAKYVGADPRNASVSADDYDSLKEAADNLAALHPEVTQTKASVGLFQGIPEMVELTQSAAGRQRLLDAAVQLPKALAMGMVDMFKVPGKVASGEIDLNTDEGMKAAIGTGIGLALGGGRPQVGRTAGGAGVSTPADIDSFLGTVRGMRGREEIDAFLKQRAEAEGGDHAQNLQIEHAKVNAEALDAAVEQAQTSKTRERSPDHFATFAEGVTEGQNLYIPADKIIDLYSKEGKAPAQGDGLFGYVPDLARKLEVAKETGADVEIPVSQYVAHTDPAVHAGLSDSVRLGDALNVEEAKELGKQEPAQPVVEGEPGTTEAATEPSLTSQQVPDEPVAKVTVERTVKEQKDLYVSPLFKDAPSDLTKTEFERYSKRIENQQKEIFDRSVELASREVKKRQTEEWKANELTARAEVESDLRSSPAVVADRFLHTGELPTGEKLPLVKLDKAAVDRLAPGNGLKSIVKEGGTDPAQLASMLGFDGPKEMLLALDAMQAERGAAGETRIKQLDRLIAEETANRMEAKHGDLAANISAEANDLARSDAHLDLISDELKIIAKEGGLSPPFARKEIEASVRGMFEQQPLAESINSKRYDRATYRAGREAEKALLKEDFAEAFFAKQTQLGALVMAKESAALDKLVKRTGKQMKRVTNEQQIDSVDQMHLEQARAMLDSVGVAQKYQPTQPLEPLAQFVADSEGQLAVADWLQTGPLPEPGKMTVQQFREFSDSLKSMMHVGRQAKVLENLHGKAELDNVVQDVIKELSRFDSFDQPLNKSLGQRATSLGRKVLASHLLVERALDYTDQFDPKGPLTSYLDRPLRDANVQEIKLTEMASQKLRSMARFTDDTINDKIDNTVITDPLAKSGFLNMTRGNLRQLMLHMGSESGAAKASKGFGVSEKQLMDLIDANATKQDWQWAQGMWSLFKELKKEADAMELRDTGVPADTVEARAIKNEHGDWTGGYSPLVYDKERGGIESLRASKNPVFSPTYRPAITPHQYTKARTEYADRLDLSGTSMPGKIQTMIHDIAFREAIRNANKLISHPDFMLEMRRKWGNETAELLPDWLRDIANTQNTDSAYAKDAARAVSIIRQNVTSALIALNPGTYIKHGFTAAVLSSRQVGAGELTKAAGEIGAKDAFKTLGDLLRPEKVPEWDADFVQALQDVTGTTERGDSVRQFILDNSAVMRNRQRQYVESVRGAYEESSEAGVGKTLGDLRHLGMTLGRVPVAWSDALSAMPTWYAAYKREMSAGNTHADAVFVADKEVSRAHGSNFVGDQPKVTQLGNDLKGEILKSFTGLYKFWNHMFNNELQAGWDAAAMARGPKEGFSQEPRANLKSMAGFIASVALIIAIEELAGPAKDEHGDSLGVQALKASLRFFGGGIVGLRDLTNAAANGYEPSVGMLGTLYKSGTSTAKDVARMWQGKDASRDWLIHTMTTLGYATGVGGNQLGKVMSFTKDLATGTETPEGFNDYRQGFRTGHSQGRQH